jgi:hypothetical protein
VAENEDLDWKNCYTGTDESLFVVHDSLVAESRFQVLYSTSNTCTNVTADISTRSERARHIMRAYQIPPYLEWCTWRKSKYSRGTRLVLMEDTSISLSLYNSILRKADTKMCVEVSKCLADCCRSSQRAEWLGTELQIALNLMMATTRTKST